MLRLRLQHTRPGMELALPIFHPRVPDCVLLREGVALDSYSIPHLRELGVLEVWIRYPGLEELTRFVDPRLYAEYRGLTARLGTVLDQAMVSNGSEVDYYACKKNLTSIIRHLTENPHSALWTGEIAGADQAFVKHCGSVAVLALLMGMKLDFYLVRERPRLPSHRAKDITPLGIGALFHDIGVLRLPPETLAHYNATRDLADPVWRKHTALGYEMTKGILDPSAAAVILHHHQCHDGSGWPHKPSLRGGSAPMSGSEIHVLARIASAADLFDRLRNPAHTPGSSAGAGAVPAVRALRQLLDPALARTIDPVVRTTLFSVVPAFPPGSLVTLSDGTDAVVVQTNVQQPCRPVVEIMNAEELRPRRRKGRAQRIDLRESPHLTIAAIDGMDVRGDVFEASGHEQFDIALVERAMTNRAAGDLAQAAAATSGRREGEDRTAARDAA